MTFGWDPKSGRKRDICLKKREKTGYWVEKQGEKSWRNIAMKKREIYRESGRAENQAKIGSQPLKAGDLEYMQT